MSRHPPLALKGPQATCNRLAALSLGLLLLPSSGFAETIRVTAWNLQPPAGRTAGTNDAFFAETTAALKELVPDVILLQGADDWQTCARLAQALKPADYRVLTCSAFRDSRTGAASPQQVAILARQQGYFSWSEAWQATGQTGAVGGFAFAAIRFGKQRVGFYSAQIEGPARQELEGGAGESVVRQLLAQVSSVKQWVDNRPGIFVVATSLASERESATSAPAEGLRFFDEAGFADVIRQMPPAERMAFSRNASRPDAATDRIFIAPPALASPPQILRVSAARHCPLTCEIELSPGKPAAVSDNRVSAPLEGAPLQAESAQTLSSRPSPLDAQPSAPGPLSLLLALAAGGVGALVAIVTLFWFLTWRKPYRKPAAPALLADSIENDGTVTTSYTVILAPDSAGHSAAESAGPGSSPQPVIRVETRGIPVNPSIAWQQRALAAERQADQAQAILREGLLPSLRQWLQQKLVRKLIADRVNLLEAQQAATLKVLAVDERLARVEAQVQQQTQHYERRIEELTRELLAAKEESRELIRAQIERVKAEMAAARASLLAKAKAED